MTTTSVPPGGHAEPGERLMAARPRLRSDLVLGAPQQRGPVRVHQVRILGTGRTMEVGAKEHFVMSRLDGRRTLHEVGADYEREFGAVLDPAGWGRILGTLHRAGMVAVEPEQSQQPARPRVRGGRHALRLPRTPGRPRTWRVVRNPAPLLDMLVRATRPLFSPWLAVPLLAAVVVMVVLLAGRAGELAEQTGALLSRPGPLLLAGVGSWLLAAVHEVAHGVAARRYGVPVLEIGVRWLPPLAMPYCRTDAYLYLPRRRSHVVIAGSGILVELALLLPAFAAWWWWTPAGTIGDVLAALLLCGGVHALVNLLPVPPLDGYKLLSHALGIADYARHTGVYLTLLGRRDPSTAMYPRRARIAYLAYGLGAVATVLALLGASLVAAHAWLGWPGVGGAAAVLVAGGAAAARRTAGVVRRRAHSQRTERGVDPSTAGRSSGRHRAPAAPVPAASRPAPSGGPSAGPPVTTLRSVDRATPGPALVLDGVVKQYAGRRAVDEVRLEVATGEFLGLLGPNGAGKTTLVEIAVGLRRADAGTVTLLGEPSWPRRTDLLRRVGVQTQSAAFFVRLTAREHLRTVAALYGLGRDAAEEALHVVGLGRLGETRAEKLSGGQRQRLAIAAALVHDPEVLFLDEPTASLDPQARRELWDVLRRLHADGRTIVYTTHHIDEAEALCTRVAIMAQGAVVASGAPYDLIDAAALPTRLVVPRDAITLDAARAVPGVTAAVLEGPSVVIETHHAAVVLERLHTVVGLRGVQTRPPTLEDVYLDRIRSELAS
jgi:ABC-type multidrug transport system ATPase subunit